MPSVIFKMPALVGLNASKNNWRVLADDIKNLKLLRSLSLRENKFKEFPPVLYELSLVTLDLGKNKLSDLSGEFKKGCPSTLDLSFNRFSTFPQTLCKEEGCISLFFCKKSYIENS